MGERGYLKEDGNAKGQIQTLGKKIESLAQQTDPQNFKAAEKLNQLCS